MNLVYLAIAFGLMVLVEFNSTAFVLGDLFWLSHVWEWAPGDRVGLIGVLLVMATFSWFLVAGL